MVGTVAVEKQDQDGDYIRLVVHLTSDNAGDVSTTNLPEINAKLVQAVCIPKNAALTAFNLDVYTPIFDATFAATRTNIIDSNATPNNAVTYLTITTTGARDVIHGSLAIKADTMGVAGKADIHLTFEK